MYSFSSLQSLSTVPMFQIGDGPWPAVGEGFRVWSALDSKATPSKTGDLLRAARMNDALSVPENCRIVSPVESLTYGDGCVVCGWCVEDVL